MIVMDEVNSEIFQCLKFVLVLVIALHFILKAMFIWLSAQFTFHLRFTYLLNLLSISTLSIPLDEIKNSTLHLINDPESSRNVR